MPDQDASSLSARAQEILRRADAQLAALKAPLPAAPARPAWMDAAQAPAEPPAAEPAPEDPRPPAVRDLGELLGTVEAGIGAARAHLLTLSASLERVAQELDAVAEEQRRTLPPQLAEHARLPEERAARLLAEPVAPPPEAVAPPPGPIASPGRPAGNAAYDAARLVAIEMAVAGDTREGVGRRLREEFGIQDPRPILDDAFGPDPGAGGRTRYGA